MERGQPCPHGRDCVREKLALTKIGKLTPREL